MPGRPISSAGLAADPWTSRSEPRARRRRSWQDRPARAESAPRGCRADVHDPTPWRGRSLRLGAVTPAPSPRLLESPSWLPSPTRAGAPVRVQLRARATVQGWPGSGHISASRSGPAGWTRRTIRCKANFQSWPAGRTARQVPLRARGGESESGALPLRSDT